MRLLKVDNSGNLSLTEDLSDSIPPYAILSHTWGADGDEVTFDDVQNGMESYTYKSGYAKIQFCAQQARKDGLEFYWVDTCCINKANLSELSETINSMFRWYQKAERCYVYLSDVSARKRNSDGQTNGMWEAAFRASRWLTRGWTLQELLAPTSVAFFSRDGQLLGDKLELNGLIREATQIPNSALQGDSLSEYTIDERKRWVAKRNTKKAEDKVYCLLGIFDVSMSLIYGEGEKKAWIRLNDEIVRSVRSQLDGVEPNSVTSTMHDRGGRVTDRRKELLASLSFVQMDSRHSTIKSAYSTTCKWLLKHPAYVAWTNPDELHRHHGFLWINGKPGAGKSTLMKFAHACATTDRFEGEILVSFYFNARGDELERSTIGMYRSLLFQLLETAVDLQEVSVSLLSSLGNQSQGPTWTVELLQRLLSCAIAKLGNRRLKCFIDALDECDEQQVQEMVNFFEELAQNTLDNGRKVLVCFASRHYPTIDIQSGRRLTLENEDGHGEGLAKYVQNHLKAGKGKFIEEIRTLVRERANGVFMWVVLVVDILNEEFRRGRIFAVKKRLQEIPGKLSDLFKEILRRDCANMNDLLLCLQWILFAKRPLGREEYYFAMVAGLDSDPENMSEWDSEQIDVDYMTCFVLSSSKGLAELTKSKLPTVQFIHESVRDFLIKDGGLCELWPELGADLYSSSHDHLKRCCQNYLRVNSSGHRSSGKALPKASSAAAKDLRQRLTIQFPFLDYASRHVLYHADESAHKFPQDDFLGDFAFESWLQITNTFERYDVRRYTPTASLPYILAEKNFARLIWTVHRKGLKLNSRGERYGYPLFAAFASDSRDAVRALLLQDEDSPIEDITAHLEFGREFSVPTYHTPLTWALEKGHEALAEILVASEDNDVFLTTRRGRSVLSIAAEKGYSRVVDFTITSRNVNANWGGKSCRTPLSHAVEHGQTAVVQLLLCKGANIEATDEDGTTPLLEAVRNHNKTMVQLLLQKGAHIEAVDIHGTTPLLGAVRKGDKTTIQLLLEQGADIEAVDIHGTTPLLRAVEESDKIVIQLLLEQGANIEAVDACGRTPLIRVARKDYNTIVQLLLEQGANIEAVDECGMTSLLWAARSGDQTTVQLLLQQGANIHAIDKSGRTPLLDAARHNNETAVQLLLEGANIEAVDAWNMTPLLWAARNGNKTIMQLLLQQRANIEAKDLYGSTPLLQAAWGGDKTAVQLLLEQGADIGAANNLGKTLFSYYDRSGHKFIAQPLHAQNLRIGNDEDTV